VVPIEKPGIYILFVEDKLALDEDAGATVAANNHSTFRNILSRIRYTQADIMQMPEYLSNSFRL
jgi:hypothetical protein